MAIPYSKPLPKITSEMRSFWEQVKAGHFAVQTCNSCGHAHFPGSPRCPACLSLDQEWKPASGFGTVESWVDMFKAYWDGFSEELPYRVCLIRLEEGPLIVSNLVGDGKPSLGARVAVVFEAVTDEITLPKFKIVSDSLGAE